MSTIAERLPVDTDVDSYTQYRSVSFLAVCALAWGVMALAGFLFVPLLALGLVGVMLGVLALQSIRRRADELTGSRLAQIGLVLSLFSLFGGGALHAAVYFTEVPEGFRRITFDELQPDEQMPELPVSPAALELDGREVFVKGYVYPDGQKNGIKRFILVPDMGTCCFGGQPKLTDMIEVTLKDPLRIDYSLQRRKIAGVLKVDGRKKPVNGLDGVFYQLEATYVR